MTNMRRGFTMIELIFVIVIIGILAAVAIPKLQGVSQDAEVAKIQSYAGSLSRTVMPGVWSRSLRENKGGDVSSYNVEIARDLPAPKDLKMDKNSFAKTNFIDANSTLDFSDPSAAAPGKVIAQEKIDQTTYQVVCKNGNKYQAPLCDVWDGTRYLLGSKNAH